MKVIREYRVISNEDCEVFQKNLISIFKNFKIKDMN